MAAWSTGPATSLVRVVVVGPDRQNVKTFEAWCLGDMIAGWSRCPHIIVWSLGQTYKISNLHAKILQMGDPSRASLICGTTRA